MVARSYKPTCSVVIKKNVTRTSVQEGLLTSQRHASVPGTIDLTPYLGEGASIMVSRSTHSIVGRWSVTLRDQVIREIDDGLSGWVEPWDVVEIRLAHQPGASGPPMVMRGFVREIREVSRLTGRGPDRMITLMGEDYGGLIQSILINYLPGYVIGSELLSTFPLFTKYNVGFSTTMQASTFFQMVLDKLINVYIGNMQTASGASGTSSSPLISMSLKADDNLTQLVSPMGLNDWPGGTVDGMLSFFGDVGPFNEIFLNDSESATVLHYRPLPYKDKAGAFVNDLSGVVEVSDITSESLIDLSLTRSDRNVANYYWVNCPQYVLIDGAATQAAALSDKSNLVLTTGNSNPNLYGIRPMMVDSQQGARLDGQKASDQQTQLGTDLSNLAAKRSQLIRQNQDNVLWESGTLTIRGNEAIKPGSYVRVFSRGNDDKKGSLGYEAYVVGVEHAVQWGGSFITRLQVERCDRFIRRVQSQQDTLLQDGRQGGVYA